MPHNSNLYQKPHVSFYHEFSALKVVIETQRLSIRSYKDEDFESSAMLYSHEKLTKYFDQGKPKSRLEVESLINNIGTKYFNMGEPFGLFSIFQKKDMAFIGHIDLIPIDEPGSVEIGCIFDRRYHNQGFCSEAVRAFIFTYIESLNNEGFKSNGFVINKIIATVHPSNYASKRIIQNIGMTLDKSEERFGHPRLWFSLSL